MQGEVREEEMKIETKCPHCKKELIVFTADNLIELAEEMGTPWNLPIGPERDAWLEAEAVAAQPKIGVDITKP